MNPLHRNKECRLDISQKELVFSSRFLKTRYPPRFRVREIRLDEQAWVRADPGMKPFCGSRIWKPKKKKLQTWACPYVSLCSSTLTDKLHLFTSNFRGRRLVSWLRGVTAKAWGIPWVCDCVATPASMGYPLWIFNKNSTVLSLAKNGKKHTSKSHREGTSSFCSTLEVDDSMSRRDWCMVIPGSPPPP